MVHPSFGPVRSGRFATAVLVIVLVLLASAPSSAVSVEVTKEGLPQALYRASAVWTGERIYIFGGNAQGAILDTIYEYDPGTGQVMDTGWRLPSPRMITSAVWTGEEAYIVGGVGYDAEPFPDVVRFVPGEGVETFAGALPYGTVGVGSVWDGEHVYVLGNSLSASQGHGDVLRYDPVANETTVLEDQLPIPGAGTSVVWTGEEAYIFGGKVNMTTLSDRIVRFVPGSGGSFVEARLPSPRFHVTAAWDGHVAYVLGGSESTPGPGGGLLTQNTDQVLVFDPASGSVEVLDARLPRPKDARPAVWAEGAVHQFGGSTKEGPLAEILVIDPHGGDDGDGADGNTWRNLYALVGSLGLVLVTVVAVTLIFRRGD